jgi:hypothetical protein
MSGHRIPGPVIVNYTNDWLLSTDALSPFWFGTRFPTGNNTRVLDD